MFFVFFYFLVKCERRVKLLITELKTNQTARLLGLEPLPYNTLLDGFHRFNSKYFKELFSQ
ncbi:MAG: hypothetical protein KAI79_14790, partial [Bacteroidales bacterium]|nr:hypothetical protein [Bacteroidales bacterium]